MTVKTIVSIALVVFIVAGLVFLQVTKRKTIIKLIWAVTSVAAFNIYGGKNGYRFPNKNESAFKAV